MNQIFDHFFDLLYYLDERGRDMNAAKRSIDWIEQNPCPLNVSQVFKY